MASNFPTSYDTETGEWAEAQDLVVLTLNGAIGATDTSATFNETGEVDNLNVPTYLTFEDEDTSGNFEIVKVTATGSAGSGDVTISRGALSSTAMAHANAAQAVQDPVSQHLASIRTLLLGIEKYHGLVGVEASLPGTCAEGECYIATDTSKVFYAVATNTWREVNELDHNTLGGLGDDDHPQYHNDSRKATWHTALTGDHITKAAHNHDGTSDDGQPVARFEYGADASKPTGPLDGQIYFATDTGNLYIGNSSSWVRYSVMPTETIIMFEGACPEGYTEMTVFQEKMPRGAPTGVYSGFSDGGSATHDHDMDEVVNHTHTIQSSSESLLGAGAHTHTKGNHEDGGTPGNNKTYDNTHASTTVLYYGHSSHTHSVTFPQHDTQDTGVNPATTDAESSWPPYSNLVFCEKD